MDESEKVLPIGADNKGEILVKGPQVMKGYWKNSKATKGVVNSAGWLKTGDYGYLDKAGYLFIVDRLKDIIIVSGLNNKVNPGGFANMLTFPGFFNSGKCFIDIFSYQRKKKVV